MNERIEPYLNDLATRERAEGEERWSAGPPSVSTSASLLPYLALFSGLAVIGFSAIFVKWANAPGPVTGFYRMAIAAAVTAIPFGVQAKRGSRARPRHLFFAVLAGLFFAGDLATWNTAILITNAANATLFGNTSPLWVGMGALILFKERLRPMFWGGVLLAMFGAAVILGQDFLIHPMLGTGDLLGLLSGFFYGMFFLATERARGGLRSLLVWWISSAVATVALFTLTLLFRQTLTGYPAVTYFSVVALALIVQVLGWLCITYAVGHLPASIVSPTLLGQPVITAIVAVPLLGQSLSQTQVLGGLVVLGGILLVHHSKF
ncbi:MAG: DMT family transporter [Chloroflexi bacterium]|nr:DMT family transporter [Chloroflexota bacterium]